MISVPQPTLCVPYEVALSAIPNLLYSVASFHESTALFARIIHEEASDVEHVTWAQLMLDIKNALAELKLFGLERRANIGVLASSSYRYYVTFMALLAGEWIPVLLSPKNSPAALEHLLRSASSAHLLTDDANNALGVTVSKVMGDLRVCGLATIKRPRDFHPEEDLDMDYVSLDPKEVAYYLHTSGTTGHPKLISITHKNFHEVFEAELRTPYNGLPLYASLPLYHGGGAFAYYVWPLSTGVIPTFVDNTTPLNAPKLLKHLNLLSRAVVICPPSILDEVVDAGVEAIKGLCHCHRVFSGGATIKEKTGSMLVSNGVTLVNLYGMSELMGFSVRELPSENLLEDWPYLRFHDGFDLRFLPVDGNSEALELLVCPGTRRSPAIFNHLNPHGFATGDLWAPHPRIKGLWKHVGRRNAITVLSNGEKTDNKQLESLLLEDELIAKVVVFGSGRFMNGVILEPRHPMESAVEFLRAVEPTVERVNNIIPRHSRLLPEMIIVAKSDKPISLTDKGTIKTKETIDSYADEIEAAYSRLESVEEFETSGNRSMCDFSETLERTFRSLGLSHLHEEEDFFDHGMDSLQALKLRAIIAGMLCSSKRDPISVPRDIVYQYSSLKKLRDYIVHVAKGEINLSTLEAKPPTTTTASQIEEVIGKFSRGFEAVSKGARRASIILTGSTGSLGCNLLNELLQSQDVQRVHCFIRSSDEPPVDKQRRALAFHSVDETILDRYSSKLVFHCVDISRGDFGLDNDNLSMLKDNVTHVVHAAWNLNFNLNLAHFESVYIASVRNLIDFCLSSPRLESPRFIFFSSVAAVGNLREGVPESPISNSNASFGMGYAQAKYVCERILDAATLCGLRYTVVRVGQLSGSSSTGSWNSREWVPMLIKSCASLNAVPCDLEPMHWLPVDVAAKLVIPMLSLTSSASKPQYFHLQNPAETPWATVVGAITHYMPLIRCIPLSEWLVELESSFTLEAPLTLPALKLANYFKSKGNSKGFVKLDISRTLDLIPELDYGPISFELLKIYILAALKAQP